MKKVIYKILNIIKIVFVVSGLWICIFSIAFILLNYLIMPAFVGQFDKLIEIPNFVGMNLEEATQKINKKKLRYNIDTVFKFSASIPKNHVLRQNPKKGVKVKKNREMWLEVSKGLPYLKVPKLLGLSLRQLKIILQQEKLELGDLNFASHELLPKGAVYFIDPAEGVFVEKGSKINVSISTGKPLREEKVSLIGWSISKAQKWLRENGYEMGKVRYVENSDVLPNTVLGHYPSVIILKNRAKPVFLEVSK